MTIIDFHSHNFPVSVAARAIGRMSKAVEGLLWPVGDGTLENQLDHMELAAVDKAVMLPVATKPSQYQVILRTAMAIREGGLGERAQRRIIPFAAVHPADPQWAQHLEEVAALGFKGIKVHPYYQDFSLSDRSLWPFFAKIADLGLVVQCHAGYDIGYPGRYDSTAPSDIVALMKNVRPLKFVAAHLGGVFGHGIEAVERIMECGAYIDTSALHFNWHRDEEIRLLRSWPRDRILFATDFPWEHYPETIRWVKSVRERDDWERVFSRNALELLGMENPSGC
jgi:predicted TIM-barrel fold metal-dependent hydrolase